MFGRRSKRGGGGTEGDLKLDELCINNIRLLGVEVVQEANSGHPGAPLGQSPMAYALFTKVMNYAPGTPQWFNRDRFVLSSGHGCALLYALMHLTGYDRPTMDDLKKFRQLDSVTAGHPENELLEGVEVSTGPLGQGISNAVGLAAAAAHMAARFNREGFNIISNFTYVICGDGCLQEGVSSEACSLAGHLKLGKLIVLYDDNNITIDGETGLSFTEDVGKRYEAYGWQVLRVEDGNKSDVSDIVQAVRKAQATTDKPTLIRVKTTIGFGATKQGTAKVHGSPLGWDDIKKLRESFGMDPDARFSVPGEVRSHLGAQRAKGEELVQKWEEQFEAYKEAHPGLAAELARRIVGDLPDGWESNLPVWKPEDKALATRKSSQVVLNAAAAAIPEVVGGSADLTPSNLTDFENAGNFQAQSPEGRYFHFGVREHGMTAIINGMAAYGGLIPFGATFLNFAGYALGAMRLSALSRFRVLFIMTHDSIGLGEDGPTHQPVGMLTTLRSIPNLYVFRPGDANEVSGSYKAAIKLKHSPSVLSLTRQNVPNLEHSSGDSVAKGAYIVFRVEGIPDVTLAATGSELSVAIEAAELLKESEGLNANVVSMPCFELFEEQSMEYKKEIFHKGVPVVSIEAAGSFGWQKYAHAHVAMDSFGKSGKGDELMKHFGFTKENLAAKAKLAVEKLGNNASWLVDTF